MTSMFPLEVWLSPWVLGVLAAALAVPARGEGVQTLTPFIKFSRGVLKRATHRTIGFTGPIPLALDFRQPLLQVVRRRPVARGKRAGGAAVPITLSNFN